MYKTLHNCGIEVVLKALMKYANFKNWVNYLDTQKLQEIVPRKTYCVSSLLDSSFITAILFSCVIGPMHCYVITTSGQID